MEDLSNAYISPLPDSPYVKPFRFNYTQNGKEKSWDLLEVHDSVAIIVFNVTRKVMTFVKQFRPAIYYNCIDQADRMGSVIDHKKYPASLGIALEMCAGIVDKDKSLVHIAQEEVLEECGYNVPVKSLERIVSYRSGVGVQGSMQTLFYCEVTDDMKTEQGGGCNFPATWTGGWFQSGMPGLIYINATNIAGKGECSELDTNDKFIVHDRNEDCFRCMVIHEKHKYVLQYKETFCLPRDSLPTLCDGITGDAALYSMFKKEPFPTPVQCPFRPAPFTFTYSRGSDDCTNPPSRAESCTDDSRLLLRYMACPDQPGTESNVEELICLATWKEGSTRYLVGLISQVQRRNTIQTDEDMFRCFVYRGQHVEKVVTYDIAQSGDATCNGLTSPVDGSRTMKLTNSDDEHNRCHFPSWIVEHHKWYSLDHTHEYHFTTKNATLKINKGNTLEEKRLVCHSILQQKDKQLVTLVAHLTRGCESGHVCVKLYRREGNVLEMQLGKSLYETPQDACADERFTPHVTLVATALFPVRCPILGRFTIVDSVPDRRRRRQPPMQLDEAESADGSERAVECVAGQFDSASVGCHHQRDTIEFHSACSTAVYNCYGSWEEDGLGLVVAGPQARSPPHAHALCFLYTTYVKNDSFGTPIQYLSMSLLGRACDRTVLPGVAGDKAYNLTLNGTCEQSSKYNSVASRLAPAVVAIVVVALLVAS